MACFPAAAAWRGAARIVGRLRRMTAACAARLARSRRDVRVSRLSADWLRKHERETAKHDASL